MGVEVPTNGILNQWLMLKRLCKMVIMYKSTFILVHAFDVQLNGKTLPLYFSWQVSYFNLFVLLLFQCYQYCIVIVIVIIFIASKMIHILN